MKFPNWFKVTWWLILILVSGYILCHRINEIINGNSNQTDTVIFLIFIALMLVPIFPEVDLLGIKLKQSLDDLKEYINVKVGDIKTEIHSNHVQSVYIQNYEKPSPESKLRDIEEKIKQEITPELKHNSKIDLDIPDANLLLFKVRYNIEIELRRIWEKYYPKSNKPIPLMEIIRTLLKNNILNTNIYNPLREILAICNYAIHGEKVSDNQVSFIKDYANELILYLQQQ